MTKRFPRGLRPLLRYLDGLPRASDAEKVGSIVASWDRNTAVGIRDFAILTALARLGVRAQEVAHLALKDIYWRAGDFLAHGKGSRLERLPLPADVGEAVLGEDRPDAAYPWLATALRHREGCPAPTTS